MVDCYAKFATENLLSAASRIESREGDVTELSRFRHAYKDKSLTLTRKALNLLAPRPGLEPGTYGLTVRRSTN